MKKTLMILTIMLFTTSAVFAAALNEGFEGTFPPTDWTLDSTGPDTAPWTQSTTEYHSGTHSAKANFGGYGTYTNEWLITPRLVIANGDSISFWRLFDAGSAYYPDTLEILVSDNGMGSWTSLAIATPDSTDDPDFVYRAYDLSSYTGDNGYVAFRYASEWGYASYIDDVSGPELYVPACPKPTDLTTTNITQTTADLGWTEAGTATTWEYDYGVTGYGPPVGAGTSTTSNPVNITGLSPSTTYDWYVRADCGAKEVSDWAGPATFTTACAPVTTFPYTEGFEDDWIGDPAAPPCWLVVDNNTDGDKWYQNTVSTYVHSGTKSATIYTDYNTSNDDWLITPAIDLSAKTDYRLKFWVRARSSSEFEELQVLLSTTNNDITSFTNTLMASTPIDFTTYTEYTISLEAYSSTVYIAFVRNQSPADGWYLYLDDVTVEEIPAVPIISVDPDEKDFGLLIAGNTSDPQTFTISNVGGGTLTIANGDISLTGADTDQFTLTDTNTYPINLTSGQSATVDVSFSPTTEGNKTANLTIVDNRGTTDIPVSGDAVPSDYVFEGFDDTTFPPAGWTNDGWSRSTTHYEGSGSAYKYGSSTTQYILYTPLLNVGSGDKLYFWGRTTSLSGDLEIVYSADGTSWTLLETITYSATYTWEHQTVDLTSIAKSDLYIGFRTSLYSASRYIDNVIHPPIVPIPPEVPTDPDPADDETDVLENVDLTWTNGFATETVDVYFSTNETLVTNKDASVKVIDDLDVETYDPGTMPYSTEYFWRVVCKNAAKAETDGPVWSFTTAPEGLFQIGDGTEVNKFLPIAPYYGYDYNQTIYLSSDFSGVDADQRIEKLYYNYTKSSTGDVDEDDWKIWIGTTANTHLDAGYIDVSTLTEVFDGSVGFGALPAGDGWLEITLVTPFDYKPADGNLVIAVYEYHSGYTSSSDDFYCDQDTRANLSRYYHSDSNNPDPTSPPDGTASAYYPNTRFQFEDIPSSPVYSISPETKDFGTIDVNQSSSAQTFTISNTGGGTLTITSVSKTGTDADQFTLTDLNSYPHDLTTGQSITVDVAFSPTTAGSKSANLTVESSAKVTHNAALSGVGFDPYITSFPYTQNFDGVTPPALPLDWAKIDDTGSSWTDLETVASNAHSEPNSVKLYNYDETTGNLILISPPTELSVSDTRVKFWAKGSSGYKVNVGTMSDKTNAATFSSLEVVDLSSTYTQYTVNISGGSKADTYIAFKHGMTGTYHSIYIDDFTWEEIPTTPVFSIDPALKDFGTVYVGETSSAQTFTISNTGVGTLTIDPAITITGTDNTQFSLNDVNTYPKNLGAGENMTVDVTFEPTSTGAKTANLHITDNLAKTAHDIPLSGTGFVPPQGSICADPLPLTLPAVSVTGNTDGFFDDYNREDIDPPSYYLNGDDVVYQFTTTEEAILSGTIVTTGSWIGAFILIDCPNPTTPPTPVIQKTSTGNTLTYNDVLPAGTYFLIISSWPTPQSIDYTINLSVGPLGVPANVIISVDAAGLTTVAWDAVTGADSYIVYGCDEPYGTFTDISGEGSFTGASWTSTASLGDKKFIKITAVKTAKCIIPQPLNSEERRKLASEKDSRR